MSILINPYYVIPSTDPDAQAFITAASITDPTQQSAVNQLVIDLKAASIWTKMKAVYPFVGGSASSHKWNLKDPRDLDAAYRLTFSGGWTHSTTGALPNGTNGYANTFFTPSTHATLNDEAIGFAIRTNNAAISGDPVDMGSFNSVSQASIVSSAASAATRLNAASVSAAQVTRVGFFSACKTSATSTTLYKNGSSIATGNSGGSLPTNEVLIGNMAINVGPTPYGIGYTNNEFTIAFISTALNGTENAALATAVSTFNTTLSR